MRLHFFIAIILTAGCLLPAFGQSRKIIYQTPDAQQNYRQSPLPGAAALPPCIHGPAVGPPGDNVSRGQFYPQNNSGPSTLQNQPGLPQCRNSAFMGMPGDSIRSDLGHRISGSQAGVNTSSRALTGGVGLPKCRNSAYMGEPGDSIRSDLGRRISGETIQSAMPARQQVRQAGARNPGGQAVSQPVIYTYKDYTR